MLLIHVLKNVTSHFFNDALKFRRDKRIKKLKEMTTLFFALDIMDNTFVTSQ